MAIVGQHSLRQWRGGLVCLGAVLMAACLAAAPEAVRELSRQGPNITLGTSAFRLTVEPTGTIRDVRVGDTQLLSFIALYTTPTSPETGQGVRGCQAETPGLGDRPPQMDVSTGDGAAQVAITRVCSHPQVLDNAPLWRLVETVQISPRGELQVRYRCHFDRLLRWGGFSVAVALTMDAMRDRTLEAYLPGLTVPARAPGDLPTRDEAREMMGAQLETSAGSLRLWLGGTGRCEIQDWTRYLTFLAAPEAMPHGGMTMYRDTECGFSAALRLPVQ